MARVNKEDIPNWVWKDLVVEDLQRQLRFIEKELRLYKSVYPRPKILKEVIHHPPHSRSSSCLYGSPAWDEYKYF